MSTVLRALIVEDEPADAELLVRYLSRNGFDVRWERVCSGDALREALDRPWDVVLSDYEMPGFGALEALAIVRSRPPILPFITLSGTIGEETAVEVLLAGADDFLVKGRFARLIPSIARARREARERHDRRLAEEALRASEERFRTLVSAIDDLVFTVDAQGNYDGAYGRWLSREGLSPHDFLGRQAQARGVDREIARALTGERVVYEWSAEGPDGPRQFQTALSPVHDASGRVTGAVGVARDVTQQRALQGQLAATDRMATMGTLAAATAHEINNPLAAVVANLDLAVRHLARAALRPGDLAELREEIGDAREAAELVRNIARDLKVFSHVVDDTQAPVDLHRVLDSTCRMAWNEIRHRARLVKDYGEVPLVEANEGRLGQVFLNLVVNAAQAIPEGDANGNEIRVRTCLGPDGRVQIEVSDTGCGIPRHLRPKLFSPFFTTKPPGEGTGLGLAICRGIVADLGGDIELESELGRGTTFRIVLPATRAPPKPEHAPPTAAPTPALRGRVLIVDDDPLVAAALRRILSAHSVDMITDAGLALERIAAGERWDVLLCDVMMPRTSGVDFYEALRDTVPDQAERLVFLTGGAFTARTRAFLETSAAPRLEKPFEVSSVMAAVAGVLRR